MREGGFTFRLLRRVLDELWNNKNKELPVSELIKKCKVSNHTFYNILNFLEGYGLIEKGPVMSSLTDRRMMIYKLSLKGELFYNGCFRRFFPDLTSER